MLNFIWFALILVSIVCGLVTGRLDMLSSAVMDGAKSAVELCIFLLGTMCAWTGFLKIAERAGLTELLADGFSPVIDRLFPEYKRNKEVKGKICMNLSANLLGLGNAATPLGLSAMNAMERENTTGSPTRGMILFVVINTASLQLIPMNMAALRAQYGSAEPFGILPQVWITSLASLLVCTLFCKMGERSGIWSK